MANPNVVINSVTYQACPEVDIPTSDGGTAKFFYTGDADFSAADVLTGKTAFGPEGAVPGSMTNNGQTGGTIGTVAGTYQIPAGHTSGGSVSLTNVTDCVAQNILSGKSILGVAGSLSMVSVSQDGTSKILSIS